MLEPMDKALLLFILICIVYFYSNKIIRGYKIKRYVDQAKARDKNIIKALEKQGYNVIDICTPKRIQYYKDETNQVDYIEPKLVVKYQGKKLLVESYTAHQTVSLRDSLIKLKILSNMVCYNIKGVLFINTKGEAIKECSVKISKDTVLFDICKKGFILVVFTILGIYINRLFL